MVISSSGESRFDPAAPKSELESKERLMTSDVTKLRRRETKKLQKAFDGCAARILEVRAVRPELQTCEFGYYPDGSRRDEVNSYGGTVHPGNRVWEVCELFGVAVYVWEDVDWGLWRSSRTLAKTAELDNGELRLAVTDPSMKVHHRIGPYLAAVKIDTIVGDTHRWSIDTIVAVREALTRMYTPKDLALRLADSYYEAK